jgi:anti-sigma factor RsiW
MTEQTPLELELHGYVDGALDDEAMIEIERYLQREPDAAAKVRDYLQHKAHIRAFAQSAAAEPPPQALAALEKQLARRLRRGSLFRWPRVAVFALLFAAGWVGHVVYVPLVTAPPYTDEVIQAHLLAATTMADGISISPERLAGMFARIGERDHVPDLRLLGLQPTAAQLIPSDEGVVLHITYRDAAGVVVSYFVLHDNEHDMEIPRHVLQRNGIALLYWQHDRSRYAVAAPLTLDRLEVIAELIEPAAKI